MNVHPFKFIFAVTLLKSDPARKRAAPAIDISHALKPKGVKKQPARGRPRSHTPRTRHITEGMTSRLVLPCILRRKAYLGAEVRSSTRRLTLDQEDASQ